MTIHEIQLMRRSECILLNTSCGLDHAVVAR